MNPLCENQWCRNIAFNWCEECIQIDGNVTFVCDACSLCDEHLEQGNLSYSDFPHDSDVETSTPIGSPPS